MLPLLFLSCTQYQPINDYERGLFEEGARRKAVRDEEIRRLRGSMIVK
ncbi:hypothetical protein [Caldivirga sp.]|nr:hypothetical protein [Caldivirga sp.]